MIKILKPDDYQPLRKDESSRQETSSRLQYEQQNSESEDQQEVQVVDTEQRGNHRVYQLSNCILIALAVFLLAAFYMETHLSTTIEVDGIEYVEVPTKYVAVIDGRTEALTYFVPESIVQSEEEVAKMRLKYRDHDCWKEILLSRKTMFPEVESWMEKYLQEYTNRILVMWEERLSLAVFLVNLKTDRKHMIDVFFKEDDSAIYLECLKLNLRRFSLEDYVRFMRRPELSVGLLRQYDMVIGSSDLLHKVIQPELLQFSVFAGRGQSASGSIYQCTLNTKLLLFYEQLPTYQETLVLDSLYNQLIRLSLSPQGRLEQEEIGSLRTETNAILLDKRQKFINTTTSNPSEQQPEWDMDSFGITSNITLQPLIPPLREMRRVEPSRLLRFFECTLSSKDLTSKGSAYNTEFRGLSLLCSEENDRDSQLSHIYNFVLQYLLAADYCNVLLAGQEELLATIVAILNTGQVYLTTTQSNSWPRIQASLNLNGLGRRLKKIEIGPDFRDFLHNNEIGLALLTPSILTIYNKIFRQALQGNMNLLLRLDEVNTDDLLRPFLQDHYIFIISEDPARNFDTQCVKNFVVQYFAGGQIAKNSFALISKNDILFEQPNPLLNDIIPSQRTIRKERHHCFNDFSNDPVQLNLQGGRRAVAVSGKVSLLVEGSSSSANEAIHAEEGIVQFLQQSITVSDKILVFSDSAPSMLILIHILKKLQAHGQASLAGLNQEQTAALEKNTNLNNLSSFYELLNEGQDSLSTLSQNTKATVIFTSLQILKKQPYVLLQLPKGAMVLLKYESSDKDFLQILSQSSLKIFQVVSTKAKPDQFGLCSSYQATQLPQSLLPSSNLLIRAWMAIFT